METTRSGGAAPLIVAEPEPATIPLPSSGRRHRRRLVVALVLFGAIVLAVPIALFALVGRTDNSSIGTPPATGAPAVPVQPPASTTTAPRPSPSAGPSTSPSRVWPGRYTAFRLRGLAGSVTYGTAAFALNDRGQAVGQSEAANGRPHAVLWDGGRVVDLGVLAAGPDEMSIARDINASGDVVGGSDGPDGMQRAVLWRADRIIDLGTLGGTSSFAYSVNDRGQIVGTSLTETGQLHGFLWQDGQMRDLGIAGETLPRAINNHGQVVGWSNFGLEGDYFPFLWQSGTVVRLAAPTAEGQATDINDRGEVVGNLVVDDVSQGFLWYRGTPTPLSIAAMAVNDRGQVLGARSVTPHSMQMHVYLWWRGAVRDLSRQGVPDEAAYNLADINNRAQFVAGANLYTPA